jgi:hypothetical protein
MTYDVLAEVLEIFEVLVGLFGLGATFLLAGRSRLFTLLSFLLVRFS